MSELKICPFCSIPLKLVGSKRRGNQHYLHEYNNNCILNGFGFIATDENIQHWNTRKPMQNIVKRLKEKSKYNTIEAENAFRHDYDELFDFHRGKRSGFDEAIEIVKEEGGIE